MKKTKLTPVFLTFILIFIVQLTRAEVITVNFDFPLMQGECVDSWETEGVTIEPAAFQSICEGNYVNGQGAFIPDTLYINLSNVSDITQIEVDIWDGCAIGCTTVGLLQNGSVNSGQANTISFEPQTLTFSGPFSNLFVYSLAIASVEGFISEVRITTGTSNCNPADLTPFACDINLFYQLEETQLYQLGYFDGVMSLPLGPDHNQYASIEAIGYNLSDNLIYGIALTENENTVLVVIDGNGDLCELRLCNDLFLDMSRWAATMDLDNNLYLTGAGTNMIQIIDVTDPNCEITTISVSGLSGEINDFVYNPNDGFLYTVLSNMLELEVTQLIKIDPTNGNWETVCDVPGVNAEGIFDAQWFLLNPFLELTLIVYDVLGQTYHQIDITNCESTLIDGYNGNFAMFDGAGCVFNFLPPEICDNGIDDDGDGLIDCDDSDCNTFCNAEKVITYELMNNFNGDPATAPLLEALGTGNFVEDPTNLFDCDGETVYHFDQNSGLSFDNNVSNFIGESYSIELVFKFENLSSWKRIIDFKNRSSDNGVYAKDGKLNFYNVTISSDAPFTVNEYSHLVVTRDTSNNNLFSMFINGEFINSFNDNNELSLLNANNVLHFFQDDLAVGNEASAGEVALIRLYNYALSASEISAIFSETSCNNTETGAIPCSDGLDNDGDGSIDCNDSDCFCFCNGQDNYFDPFDGATLNSAWTVVAPLETTDVNLNGNGFLRVETIEAGLLANANPFLNTAPRIYYPVAPGTDWTIETRVQFAPAANVDFQSAGLIALGNEDPTQRQFIKMISRDYNYVNPGHGIPTGSGEFIPFTGTDVYFRATLEGQIYTTFYSLNGIDWILVGTGNTGIIGDVHYVGLYVENGDSPSAAPSVALFDFFNLETDCENPPSGCEPTLGENLIQNPSNEPTTY